MSDDRRGFLKSLATLCVIPATAMTAAAETPAGTGNIFAHWECDLNGWRWPKEWGEPPERFHHKLYVLQGRARYEYCKEEYKDLMDVLERLAGGWKEVLRVHNVERNKSMTNAEFEEWWANDRSVAATARILAKQR